MVIVIMELKMFIFLHWFPAPSHTLDEAVQSIHGHRTRSALKSFGRPRTLNPPMFSFGLHTTYHLIFHFPPEPSLYRPKKGTPYLIGCRNGYDEKREVVNHEVHRSVMPMCFSQSIIGYL